MTAATTHTIRFHSLRPEDLPVDAVALFSTDSSEQRSKLSAWKEVLSKRPQDCVVVTAQHADSVVLERHGAFGPTSISLTDDSTLAALLSSEHIFIDISGLTHSVWASILRATMKGARKVSVVYVEPEKYRSHSSPTSPSLFDLSEGFEGVAPLPGFARLAPPSGKSLLVTLLGFEGNRPDHIAQQVDDGTKVIPVIGVPGFRIEYPTFAIACNQSFLDEHQAHSDVRFARASCPFELRDVLAEIQADNPGYHMIIAPVGTKPHSLGAVLYVLQNRDSSELIYDHPKRKPGRTEGVSLIHVYSIKP